MFEVVFLPFIAFLVGIVASMTGVGGGVLIVPVLTLLYGFEPAHASGTSIAMIVFTSLSSTIRYYKQGRIDYLLGLMLSLTSVPGGFLGSYLTAVVKGQVLGLIFAFFLMLVAFRSLVGSGRPEGRADVEGFKGGMKRRLVDRYGVTFTYSVNLWLVPVLGFLGGLFSGLLGVGGGTVLVPAMNMVLGVAMHVAVATSMFIMIFTSISSAITHMWLQHVSLYYVALLVLGVVFGAQLGAHYARRVSAKGLKRLFGVVLLIASVRMILKYTMLMP